MIVFGIQVFGQSEQENNFQILKSLNSHRNIPYLNLPRGYKSDKTLPYKIDNSLLSCFPPTLIQDHYSCGQAAGVAYSYTYEINRLRGVSSLLPENQYNYFHTFTLCNNAQSTQGVCYFDSWDIIKQSGTPTTPDYLADYGFDFVDYKMWMDGYEKYYNSMSNKLNGYSRLDVSTPDGLNILKNWLHNHLEDSDTGGVANCYIGTGSMVYNSLAEGTEEHGHSVVIKWDPYIGHAITFVGYNDSIKYDINGDGLYTNNIDITNDGIIDMQDWEIGALIYINSFSAWGEGESQKSFALYRTLALSDESGGVWNNEVHIVHAKKEHSPQLTMKVKLRHSSREKIKIMAGVTNDTSKTEPDHTISFLTFNYQGGNEPLQGIDLYGSDKIEIGLDISQLLCYAQADKPIKFFLVIEEKDPDTTAQGEILGFSVIDYSTDETEYISNINDVLINNDTTTTVSVTGMLNHSRLDIIQNEIVISEEDINLDYQFDAVGGEEPYIFELLENSYQAEEFTGEFPDSGGTRNYYPHWYQLPFPFTFYGNTYDSIFLRYGEMIFDPDFNVYPYVTSTETLLKNIRMIALYKDYLYCHPYTDGIWKYYDETSVTIIWKMSKPNYSPSSVYINCAIQLFKDGSIKMYYGDIKNPKNNWYSGVSNGSGSGEFINPYSGNNKRVANCGFKLNYTPNINDFTIDESGYLTGLIDPENMPQNIYIKVTDANNLTVTKEINIYMEEKTLEGLTISNYPNPFKETTQISLKSNKAEFIKIELFDINGCKIETIADEQIDTGINTYEINLANMNLNSGIFLCQITYDNSIRTIKLIKL